MFTGSKHTYESQYVIVSRDNGKRIILASDNAKYYYNLENLLSIPATTDKQGYIFNLRRMRAGTANGDLFVPGHDPLVFKVFASIAEDVAEIK